jgi:maleate isomerase
MTTASLERLPPAAFEARAARWRLGLIALATDHTSERDFARMRASDEVAVYVNRIAYANPTTVENLRAMTPRLGQAAALILPGEALDALAFSCAAASAVIGDDRVAAAIREPSRAFPASPPFRRHWRPSGPSP